MITKEVLAVLIKEYQETPCSIMFLERKYGISRNTIKKYLEKLNIPVKWYKYQLIDEKDVINRYVVDRQRTEDIADIYHCSIHPINNILKRYGVKRTQAESLRGKQNGSKNPNWKGGLIAYDKYALSIHAFKYKMSIWSAKILERDGIKCKLCDSEEKLNAHHIIPVRELEEKDLFNINNGITLCRKCHMKIHLKENQYIEQFKKLISGSV